MLDQMRQGAQGWVAKLLMGLLVLSFAIWGIGGFQGYRAGTIASVGDHDVTVEDYQRVYQQAERVAQQTGRPVDSQRVLSDLLHSAALDDETSKLGLGVSDDRVAAEIAKNPAFKNADGQFDRNRFEILLQNARINRESYIQDVRRDMVRGQILDTIGTGMGAPQPLVEAIYRLQNEERTVSWFVVDDTAIDKVGAPDEAVLKKYFDDNKAKYGAPEYRKLGLLTLDPGALADPASVSQADVEAEYKTRLDTFTHPERRQIEEIVFDSADAAEAAQKKAEAGTDFATIAKDSGTSVTDLGMKAKAEVIDQAMADAAFKAEKDKPVAVTEGAIQPVLIRVTAIDAGSVTPLTEVEPQLRKELATRAARDKVRDLYDKVEDERAGGSTLEETAKKLSLPYRVIDAVSAAGETPDGGKVTDIPGETEVLKDAFESDVGVENSPVRANGDQWVFTDVLEVTPARDRTLDEVHDTVVKDWTAEETASRIDKLADSLLDRLKKGEPLAKLATELGKPVETAENVKRSGTPPKGLTPNAVAQAYAGPEGHVANAEGAGQSRILLQVDRIVAPAFFAEAAGVDNIRGQLAGALKNDVAASFNNDLLQSRPARINNAVYQQITGQTQAQ